MKQLGDQPQFKFDGEQMSRPRSQELLTTGVAQNVFHAGRFSEWLKCGELALKYLEELRQDFALIEMLESAVRDVESWETKQFSSVFDFRLFRILLYIAIRTEKPTVVIETGVLHGMTTLFLLRALERNGSGRLISIDLPSFPSTGPSNRDGYVATLPAGRKPGWLVPAERYPNWDLILQASVDALPNVDVAPNSAGAFIHDSEHTFDTMWFELDWAWHHVREGGLIVCDNIEANTAFQDFCRRHNQHSIHFPAPDRQASAAGRFGIVRKA